MRGAVAPLGERAARDTRRDRHRYT
jgi:hypothetical protein